VSGLEVALGAHTYRCRRQVNLAEAKALVDRAETATAAVAQNPDAILECVDAFVDFVAYCLLPASAELLRSEVAAGGDALEGLPDFFEALVASVDRRTGHLR
jgi:hypothetical protein